VPESGGPLGSLSRRLAGRATTLLTSPKTRALRRGSAELRRRLGRLPHRVLYFHQVDDPYAQLAAQVLEAFAARYEVELVPRLAGAPPDDAVPERARLEAFARKDAADVAPGYGLAFPGAAATPQAADVGEAVRILAAALAAGRFPSVAARVGSALWAGDRAALAKLGDELGRAEPAAARAAEEAGGEERRRLGHYLGASFYYAGEWYWGVDRLHHLERRLDGLGLRRAGAGGGPLVARPGLGRGSAPAGSERLTLELYPSLRSPYSYLALERSYDLARRQNLELVLRPVLPMVMRGLPLPGAKRLYIVLDAKREAEDAGIPFGRVCDPVGAPVERCFSLLSFSRERGRAAELLLCFARAAFAEGVDTASDAGMRHVVLGAGLPWEEARARLGRDEGWRAELEANREALFAMGLWGVPSYRLLGRPGEADFHTFGQDRLWLVEAEIERRRLRPPAGH
jgi:2-hydroxychromene-2-carboxylate isomerase